MSYIRLTEERRYFPGESNLYVYPTADGGTDYNIKFNGDLNGSIESEDFWELVIRAVEKTDISNDSFWDVETAVRKYQEKESRMTEDLEKLPEDD